LLFEILNEPEGMSLSNLNFLVARIVKTIRGSGGNNARRLIVFAGTKWSSGDELTKVNLPESDHTYLIANYHQYSPWNFVSDKSGTMKWGTDDDKKAVLAIFEKVKTW
jgi:endoglucanase